MIQTLIYLAIIVAVCVVGAGGVYLKTKLNVTKEQTEMFKRILAVVDYITKSVEFKFSDDISVVVSYVFDALDFVNTYEIADLSDKKELVKNKAISLCERNNIQVDDAMVEVINMIVDFAVEKYGE
jgi:hypothetical protein